MYRHGSAHDNTLMPHTRGPVAPVSDFGRAAGMIGVEEKTKGEIEKWLSYL